MPCFLAAIMALHTHDYAKGKIRCSVTCYAQAGARPALPAVPRNNSGNNMRAASFRKRLLLHPYETLAYALLFVLLIVTMFTFSMYGFTSDEYVDFQKAARIAKFIASLGNDTEKMLIIDDINIYGGMPDLLALSLQRLIPALSFDSRHLVSALFGVAGFYYVYRLG